MHLKFSIQWKYQSSKGKIKMCLHIQVFWNLVTQSPSSKVLFKNVLQEDEKAKSKKKEDLGLEKSTVMTQQTI